MRGDGLVFHDPTKREIKSRGINGGGTQLFCEEEVMSFTPATFLSLIGGHGDLEPLPTITSGS